MVELWVGGRAVVGGSWRECFISEVQIGLDG